MRNGGRLVRAVFVGVIALGAAALLIRAFAGVDARSTLRAVSSAGPLAPLALVPFLLGVSLDAAGMLVVLRALGRTVPFARLIPLRIAAEALHLTAPAGFVVADSATVALLDARFEVPVAQGTVVVVARKWLTMRAHAAYLALGAGGGAAVLTAVSLRFLGGRWLPWAVGASALVPLALSAGLGAGFRGGCWLARLNAALARTPWAALRERSGRWRAGALSADADFSRVGAAPALEWLATASYLGCWIVEALETTLLVRLVGGPLDLATALAVEAGISLARSVGSVAPAGLGVQDAGYATLLPAMGLETHTAAAFVLLKRTKELVWIAVGYVLLASMRRPDALRDDRGLLARLRDAVSPRVAGRVV